MIQTQQPASVLAPELTNDGPSVLSDWELGSRIISEYAQGRSFYDLSEGAQRELLDGYVAASSFVQKMMRLTMPRLSVEEIEKSNMHHSMVGIQVAKVLKKHGF